MSKTVAKVKDVYDLKRNKSVFDLNRSFSLYVVTVKAPPTAEKR